MRSGNGKLKAYVISAGSKSNRGDMGNLKNTLQLLTDLYKDKDLNVSFSIVTPLLNSYAAHNHYTDQLGNIDNIQILISGCAPIMAVTTAKRQIESGEADVVAISGKEMLFTESKKDNGKIAIYSTILQESRGVPIYKYYIRTCPW